MSLGGRCCRQLGSLLPIRLLAVWQPSHGVLLSDRTNVTASCSSHRLGLEQGIVRAQICAPCPLVLVPSDGPGAECGSWCTGSARALGTQVSLFSGKSGYRPLSFRRWWHFHRPVLSTLDGQRPPRAPSLSLSFTSGRERDHRADRSPAVGRSKKEARHRISRGRAGLSLSSHSGDAPTASLSSEAISDR